MKRGRRQDSRENESDSRARGQVTEREAPRGTVVQTDPVEIHKKEDQCQEARMNVCYTKDSTKAQEEEAGERNEDDMKRL